MLIRNSILYDSCKRAIDDSIDFLQDKKGEVSASPVDIVTTSGGGISTGHSWVPNYRGLINTYTSEVVKLKAVDSFINLVLTDDHLKSQILLASGGSPDDKKRIKSIVVSGFTTILESCLLGRKFDRIYNSYETYLYSPDIGYSATALLENFDATVDEIVLGDGLEIVKLSDQELTGIYNQAEYFWAPIPKQNILRIKYKLERDYRIRKGQPDKPQIQIKLFNDLITCLRLFKPGVVGYNSAFCRSEGWHGGGFIPHMGSHYINYFGAVNKPYKLESNETEELKKAWSSYKNYNQKNFKGLSFALQRFNYSYERKPSAEKILEYMIAFEAICLTGSGDPEVRGELGYRLRLKAANFLTIHRDEKIKISAYIKKAYGIRSRIVHGDEYSEEKTVKIGGEEIKFFEFVSKIEEYLRQTINKIIVSRASKIDENIVFN